MNALPTKQPADRSSIMLLVVEHSWRDRTTLSVLEAATVFSRSTSWVRNRITDRSLEAADQNFGRSTLITVTSAIALMDRLSSQEAPATCPRRRRGAHLQLVVDNTAE